MREEEFAASEPTLAPGTSLTGPKILPQAGEDKSVFPIVPAYIGRI
jgi:hypothetical protein